MDSKPPGARPPERPLLPDRTSDEQDSGWDWREDAGNDDRLSEDVPPHW
ncbi:hypothetical protein [Actinocorallia populi]|nr:hypothetical protein [Actinocorallia populi]